MCQDFFLRRLTGKEYITTEREMQGRGATLRPRPLRGGRGVG